MGIFDGILICTDLDGTLLANDKSISDENLRAIEYFKENGGYFTFVTGRTPFYTADGWGNRTFEVSFAALPPLGRLRHYRGYKNRSVKPK